MAKSHVLGQEPGVGTEEESCEADEQFEHPLRLGTPVALATKRKPMYNHEYGVFGRDIGRKSEGGFCNLDCDTRYYELKPRARILRLRQRF